MAHLAGWLKDGTPLTESTADLIARAFGFTSAHDMNKTCEHADARRAARPNRQARAA